MDPWLGLYMQFPSMNGYTTPFVNSYYPNLEMPQMTNTQEENTKKKYKRTWNKNQIEQAFNATLQYCQKFDKKIEDLSINDFGIISMGMKQTPEQIMYKVKEINANGTLRPGKWSQNEDEILTNLIGKIGEKWGQIANYLNTELHSRLNIRNSKTCKERWNNYLNPDINRGDWNDEEDCALLQGYLKHGNKWSVIAKDLPNRIESAVKNRIKSLTHKIKQELRSGENLWDKIREIAFMKSA